MADICILLDANVLLDVLAHREPFYEASAGVWAHVETGRAQGLVAAHCVTTLFYLIARHTNRSKTMAAIQDLLRVFSVAAIDQTVIYQALSMDWRDLEDAIQACAATQAGAHYLVTRNPKDYPHSPVPVILPDEFLKLMAASGESSKM